MRIAEIDDSQWPLVVVRWQGLVTDEEVTSFLERMDGWLSRQQRFGLLLDSRGAKGFNSQQRALVLHHMKAHANLTGKYLVQAIVLDNAIQRALYNAMSWFFPPPYPSKLFSGTELAREWLVSQLPANPLSILP